MTAQKPSRAERVNRLDRAFQLQGDSEKASFDKALVVDRLTEDFGLSMEHAQAFERAFKMNAHRKIATGLQNLLELRKSEQPSQE